MATKDFVDINIVKLVYFKSIVALFLLFLLAEQACSDQINECII